MFRLAFLALLAFAPMSGAAADAPIQVVATFSILGDLVKNVGGDRVAVTTLVGPNGDAHAYSPRPTDAKKLAAARLIFINGLDFERWLDRLMDSAGTSGHVVIASRGVNPRPAASSHDAPDPHAWQTATNAAIYVGNIRDALIASDARSKDFYTANADAYIAQLAELDRAIRDTIERIPESRRSAVTPHPSFQYFAAGYGLRFISPLQIGNESEASARNIASIIDAVRREHIAAIFVESAGASRLMQQIASETGIKLGGALYADALTDSKGAAPNYIALMNHNLRTIQNALRD